MTLCAELLSHFRQLHSLENGIFWAGCAEERLVPDTAVEDIWYGVAFTYRAGKRAWSCRSCQSQTEHTLAYLKL